MMYPRPLISIRSMTRASQLCYVVSNFQVYTLTRFFFCLQLLPLTIILIINYFVRALISHTSLIQVVWQFKEKCLALWLKKSLKPFISYRNSWRLTVYDDLLPWVDLCTWTETLLEIRIQHTDCHSELCLFLFKRPVESLSISLLLPAWLCVHQGIISHVMTC